MNIKLNLKRSCIFLIWIITQEGDLFIVKFDIFLNKIKKYYLFKKFKLFKNKNLFYTKKTIRINFRLKIYFVLLDSIIFIIRITKR